MFNFISNQGMQLETKKYHLCFCLPGGSKMLKFHNAHCFYGGKERDMCTPKKSGSRA
jgi:hypothetical protein